MAHPVLAEAGLSGRPVLGGWVTIDSLAVVSAIERAGYDYIGFDCQHGAIDETQAANLVRWMGVSECATIVRVSENSATLIGRVLDAGADGVIVPLVNNATEAARAVAACSYPPNGVRSFGPSRPGLPFDFAELQSRVSCFVMIETAEGIANAEEICAVPGMAGVFVGPADLSIGLGLQPSGAFTSDQLHAPLRTLRIACENNNLLLGIFSIGGINAAQWVELGCRVITVGSDVSMLARVLADELALARIPHGGRSPAAGSSASPYPS